VDSAVTNNSSSAATSLVNLSAALNLSGSAFTASIRKVDETVTNNSSSAATSINNLVSSLNVSGSTLSASISTTQTTTAAISGSVVDLKSQYTLKVSAGSSVAGFRLAADASTSSSFIVEVDQFKIVNPNTTGTIVPFEVDGSSVKINNAYIKNLNASVITAGTISADRIGAESITAAKIATGTITANQIAASTITGAKIAATTITAGNIAANAVTADKIEAGAITAGKIAAGAITGDTITGGTITGVAFNNGSGTFSVTSAGVLTATSATISGAITATSLTATSTGTIAGWTIGAGGLSSTTSAGSKITGNGLNIDASSNQATIGLTGTYPLLLTGGAAAASIQLGSGYATKLNDSGILTLSGKEFKWNSGTNKFNVGASGTETIVCGTVEVGSGGISCSGGASFGGTVGINNSAITLNSNGDITAASFNSSSSRRYKTNIKNLTSGLSFIQQLRPVIFDWSNKDVKNDIGMIAEEVNEILPTIVYKNIKGEIDGFEYGKLVAVLTAAVKELSADVHELKRQINELKK
jgi:hypothetical protein